MSAAGKQESVNNAPPAGESGNMEYNFREIEKKWQQQY